MHLQVNASFIFWYFIRVYLYFKTSSLITIVSIPTCCQSRHFTLLLNYLAVEAAVPIFRCSLRSYSISIVLNNHGNRVRGVCINVAQETASRCRSEDNQYSVTSLSRTHCGNWKRSSRSPNSPLPVRHSAACCLTQFSSARGCRARGERRGEGGGRARRNLSHKCATPTRRREIRIRPCNIDYFCCQALSMHKRLHFMFHSLHKYTRSLLSYHQHYPTTIKIRM